MMKTHYLYKNSLSIVFVSLFLVALGAQVYFGWKTDLSEYQAHNKYIDLYHYLHSGHFMAATFENFQSEFLQMALYVILTIFLRQVGSAESKQLFQKEEVDRDPVPHSNAPFPVKKGGLTLQLYSHSLSIAFIILFVGSWIGHFYGSYQSILEEKSLKGQPPISVQDFIREPQFWFETFQNWQSEFLSVAAIVILSIFLRQKGSPESKPVDAPHLQTGK